ncbi:MAG: hypothetical protein B7Y82_13900 [Sphingomonadales bacterium 32-65-25]|nr:MAG: hypothetical protein B7Y82_13900 [Sphingomonadales bacterium 32-65-25]
MPKAKIRKAAAAPGLPRLEPTPEQQRHHRYGLAQVKDPESPAPIIVRRNLTTRNLERWLHRHLIDDRLFMAGDRYRSDYERSGFNQRTIGRYGERGMAPTSPSYAGSLPGSLQQLDARERWRRARLELPAALVLGFERLVLHDDVVAELAQLPAVDRRAFGRDSAMATAKLCLTMLASHYRIPDGA